MHVYVTTRAVFGGNSSGGFLDWLIEELDAGRRPSVGQLAAEFEARHLGRSGQQGSLLEAMRDLWLKKVVTKVRKQLSDPAIIAVVRAAMTPFGQRSSYQHELLLRLLLAVQDTKGWRALLSRVRQISFVHLLGVSMWERCTHDLA